MGSPAPLDGTEDELCRALATALHTLPRVLDGELRNRRARVTTREFVALAQLADHRDEGLRINQLAVLMGLSASRVSRLVESLSARGEVQRQQGQDDARTQRLEVTPAGLARLEAARPHHVASVRHHVIDYIDPACLPVLTAAFEAITGELRGAPDTELRLHTTHDRAASAPGIRRSPAARTGARAVGDLSPRFRQQG